MSRSISIWYKHEGRDADIETGNRDLLGTQQNSLQFWSLPRLAALGLKELTVLGYTDPVSFTGWDELAELDREVPLLEIHIADIPFDEVLKVRWIANLRYCLDKLVRTKPPDATPVLMIG